MAGYRVLTLDGGGIRGLVTTILLQRLAAAAGLDDLLERVDLLAGTSTGGVIALAIALGADLADVRDLYVQKGPDIFDDSWLDDLLDVGKIAGADYDNKNLKREVKRLYGDATLGQLRKRVIITSFDLDNDDPDPARRRWKPKLFHNFPGPNTDRGLLARRVALYTTAAPTFFPSVDGFIDGGVYAGNPSMCALAQTQDRRYQPTPALRDVRLLSLGTGTSLEYIKGGTLDWGYGQWAKPLIRVMMEGTAGIADYQCRQILGAGYHRLAPDFAPGVSVPLDGVDRIPLMIDFAQSVPIDDTVAWLQENWSAA